MPTRRTMLLGATALLDQSDQLRDRLDHQGVDDASADIRARLAQADPTEAQRHAFFDANRRLFGERSYEQSAWSVEQLVRIQLVRDQLGITRLSPYHGAAPRPVELP